MKSLDLNQRNWKTVHEFEDRRRIFCLKKKGTGGFRDFCDLYKMAAGSLRERDLMFFSVSKSRTLSRIHRVFMQLACGGR